MVTLTRGQVKRNGINAPMGGRLLVGLLVSVFLFAVGGEEVHAFDCGDYERAEIWLGGAGDEDRLIERVQPDSSQL